MRNGGDCSALIRLFLFVVVFHFLSDWHFLWRWKPGRIGRPSSHVSRAENFGALEKIRADQLTFINSINSNLSFKSQLQISASNLSFKSEMILPLFSFDK